MQTLPTARIYSVRLINYASRYSVLSHILVMIFWLYDLKVANGPPEHVPSICLTKDENYALYISQCEVYKGRFVEKICQNEHGFYIFGVLWVALW